MADIPVPPEAAVEAAAQKIGNAMITRRSPREIALAVWPVIAAGEWERADALSIQLEHAKAALARDNEGIRLWMIDCGNLVEKHRKRADGAAVAERERIAALLHATDDWDEIRALTAALAAGKDGRA